VIRVIDCALGVPAKGGTRWLVRDLAMDIDAGARIAVIGPSGAGKTTLLRALAGLVAPQRGTITLDDKPLAQWNPRLRARRIAWLPQRAEPWSDVLAQDIVALGRTPHLGALALRTATDVSAADAALAQVGVADLALRHWSTLSGGERQRVMIARMLASDARILLLDEPTSALDVGHAMRVMRCCDALARAGTTIVFATHELELARRWSDRVICIGDETAVGRTEDILVPERMAALFGVQAHWGRSMIFE
jgi:iron complex transport system ATP-binding protein